VSRNSLILFVQLRRKRHKIAVNSVAILADLLLNPAGFLPLRCKMSNLPLSWLSSKVLPTIWQV